MKKQQRNKAQAECASSAGRKTVWKGTDIARCEQKVRKLQFRIAKAQKERRYNKVKALRHFLVTSFMKLADIPIRRHVKVKCEANLYDPTWDAYFLKRIEKRNRSRLSRKGALSEPVACEGTNEPI